ncbi:MAG: glycosyltransferase family 2 protein [Campylobacterales bacterium]|nr:glycosyltransferase family 2 protein [Campylobacterales bacterium]
MKLDNLCILIPVYNNPKSIQNVTLEVLHHNIPLIVIDDGSDTPLDTIIDTHKIDIIRHKTNLGKGIALRSGAKKAYERGYKFCLTMDGDGQHFAEDIPKFLDAFKADDKQMIIGVRDFDNCNPPKSSSIGRLIGNFWVWVETGIWVKDTQTGFRLYPINFLYYNSTASRYEFEIENLVNFLWKGGKIKEVLIKTVYGKDRVTHFDKLRDNFRMIILHTILVIKRIFLLKGFYKQHTTKEHSA